MNTEPNKPDTALRIIARLVRETAVGPLCVEEAAGIEQIIREEISAWRDIATAPKDGQTILVSTEYWGVCAAAWNRDEWMAQPYGITIEPTHWQPLPEGSKK